MMDTIWEKDIAINSVLVIRNGYLVLEAYKYPYHSADTSNIYSCSKSVSSALIGIAIDKGYIKDVGQRVLDLLPTRNAEKLNTNKKDITDF